MNFSPLELLLRDSPEEFEKIIVEQDSKVEIIIHENTHPLLRKYGANGRVSLFYTLTQPEYKVELYENKDIEVTSTPIFGEKTLFARNNPEITRRVKKYLDYHSKYPIPPAKVNDVFDMIERGESPSEIMKILRIQ